MRLRVCLFVCIIWSLLFSHPVFAWQNGASILIEEYWALVNESREITSALIGQPETETRLGLEALAVRWERVKAVQTQNGQEMPLDTSAWVALMRAQHPDPEMLVKSLDSLLAERELISKQQPADLARLQEILARPEFQTKETEPNFLQQLWDRFWKWIASLQGEQTAQEQEVQVAAPGFFVELLAGLALAVVMVYVLRSLFSDFVADSAYLTQDEAQEEPITAQVALSRAENFSNRGEFRTAVRYLYLSALLILDERGLLYYDRAKTNREYLRAVSGNASIFNLLRSVIDVFDRVWYGFQTLDAETYQRYAEQVKQLEEQR